MPSRLDLQMLLEELLGSRNVYFQPPEAVKMNYPAIVYGLSNIKNSFANDRVYSSAKKYFVTVIDKDPDSPYIDAVSKLPTCQFERQYVSDNLNHSVFTLTF